MFFVFLIILKAQVYKECLCLYTDDVKQPNGKNENWMKFYIIQEHLNIHMAPPSSHYM